MICNMDLVIQIFWSILPTYCYVKWPSLVFLLIVYFHFERVEINVMTRPSCQRALDAKAFIIGWNFIYTCYFINAWLINNPIGSHIILTFFGLKKNKIYIHQDDIDVKKCLYICSNFIQFFFTITCGYIGINNLSLGCLYCSWVLFPILKSNLEVPLDSVLLFPCWVEFILFFPQVYAYLSYINDVERENNLSFPSDYTEDENIFTFIIKFFQRMIFNDDIDTDDERINNFHLELNENHGIFQMTILASDWSLVVSELSKKKSYNPFYLDHENELLFALTALIHIFMLILFLLSFHLHKYRLLFLYKKIHQILFLCHILVCYFRDDFEFSLLILRLIIMSFTQGLIEHLIYIESPD